MTDLAQHIQETPLVDTHEHQMTEADWVKRKPDAIFEIFESYLANDLASARCPQVGLENLNQPDNADVAGRFRSFQKHWEICRHTGYGEGAQLAGEIFFGIEGGSFTAENLQAAQAKAPSYHQPGQRLRILRDVANLDHIQVDHFGWFRHPDPAAPEFFMQDLNWAGFSSGEILADKLGQEVNLNVVDLDTFRQAQRALLDKYARFAVAVKTQHAYCRTLAWRERTDGEAEQAFQTIIKLKAGENDVSARNCLGDWSLAHAVQLAAEHNLPVKIHTGHLAGHSSMVIDNVRAGQLCPLFLKYPQTRFDVFHISYPYMDELVSIAKQFHNVWVDFCWAWQMNPRATGEFLRQMIHAVPANKVFVFGGDCGCPLNAAAYAQLCRKYLTRALEAEVAAGDLTETQAMRLATRFMRENQYECFDLAGRRAALEASLAKE